MNNTEEAVERRLQCEAIDNCLGNLGDPKGINVAKVEVSWYSEYASDALSYQIEENAGHYFVSATGDEPMIEAEGEFGSIYTVFETLVHEAMQKKVDAGVIDGYQIDDVSAA